MQEIPCRSAFVIVKATKTIRNIFNRKRLKQTFGRSQTKVHFKLNILLELVEFILFCRTVKTYLNKIFGDFHLIIKTIPFYRNSQLLRSVKRFKFAYVSEYNFISHYLYKELKY
jgi:hypothetical protein